MGDSRASRCFFPVIWKTAVKVESGKRLEATARVVEIQVCLKLIVRFHNLE